jgi:hypothetical protein
MSKKRKIILTVACTVYLMLFLDMTFRYPSLFDEPLSPLIAIALIAGILFIWVK